MKPPEQDLMGLMPCVEGTGTSRNFWTVTRTGHYAWDNFLGTGLADQLLKTMRSDRHHYITLNLVIRDMIAGGRFEGVEVGFMSVIAMELAKREAVARH
jgi:hypothetical protein